MFPRLECKARTAVGRGDKSLLSDPGSELLVGRKEKIRVKIIHGMEETIYMYAYGIYVSCWVRVQYATAVAVTNLLSYFGSGLALGVLSQTKKVEVNLFICKDGHLRGSKSHPETVCLFIKAEKKSNRPKKPTVYRCTRVIYC